MPSPIARAGSATKAITMWDFSWLERRWEGAGYEDWDAALDGLLERGYDAVRIDAYPHLLADSASAHTLVPVWDQCDWGSPTQITVEVEHNLIDFISRAHARGIAVALSTWFRQDTTEQRMTITSGRRLGEIWAHTLDLIADAGLLDAIYYVDLCNEWVQYPWAAFLYDIPADGTLVGLQRTDATVREWGAEAVATVRQRYPQLPFTLSVTHEYELFETEDMSLFDLLEPHIWMALDPDFYKGIGYDIGASAFDSRQVDILAESAELLYRSNEDRWRSSLQKRISHVAERSRASGLPVITTECWAIINWHERTDLPWGWVKELCEFGVQAAIAEGRWIAISTSNFCGPQFPGMWDDIEWHQNLTSAIRSSLTGEWAFQ